MKIINLLIFMFLTIFVNSIYAEYRLDPQVLKEHQERFGVEKLQKQKVIDKHGRVKVKTVPTLVIPSLVSTEPGKKIGTDSFEKVDSVLPVLPNFPEDRPYRPITVELHNFLDNDPERPAAIKYNWGNQD
jgi:hypothetical protein